MLLQYDNTTPHTSTATAAATEGIGFNVVQHRPYSLDWAPSDFCLQISRNMSKDFISLAIKFKLLWENGFGKSLEF
jgi:hypothetical protein